MDEWRRMSVLYRNGEECAYMFLMYDLIEILPQCCFYLCGYSFLYVIIINYNKHHIILIHSLNTFSQPLCLKNNHLIHEEKTVF